jgi:hypothetical protein
VLVLDARKDKDNATQISDWVKRVRATGGDSPIIVLANQIDVNPGFGFESKYDLQREFPQIKDFITLSCKDNTNIDLFKDKLAEIIPTAELFQTEIEEQWITVKNRLQKVTTKYLTQEQFIRICNEFKLKEEQKQKNAITFLHDLGSVLHFENLPLAEYYVLNPYWITYGAYQILTSKLAGYNKGIVPIDKLEHIVNKEEYKKEPYKHKDFEKITYSPNEIRFLTDILHEFKLCFWTTDREHFIIPDLLETDEPSQITKPIRLSDKRIQFVYRYDYLPKSVMPNIMVETHHIIKDMWRTGCVLQKDGCKALIKNYQNRIFITVTGEHKKKREFMAIIRNTIDSINLKLSNQPYMLIPLPGMDNEYVDYEELLAREKDGEKYYTVYKPTKKMFEISELLEGIPTFNELKEVKAQLDEISDKIDRLFNDNQQKLDEIISAIQVSTEISSSEQQEMITKLSEYKKELNKHKSDKRKMERANAIFCGVLSNVTYSIIKKFFNDIGVPLIS